MRVPDSLKKPEETYEEGAAWPIVDKATFLRPELSGSPKQIAWAEDIRGEIIPYYEAACEGMSLALAVSGEMGDRAAKMYLSYHRPTEANPGWMLRVCRHAMDQFRTPGDLRAAVEGVSSAHWWIENRMDVFDALTDLASKIFQAPVADSDIEEAMAESLLVPEGGSKRRIPVRLYRTGGCLRIWRTGFSEDLRTLAKSMGYAWHSRAWELALDEFAGDPVERMAEAAARLVGAGFPVICHDAEARAVALAGEWSPMQTKWIYRPADVDEFAIKWGRDDDYFCKAKTLPGATWDHVRMLVPFDAAFAVAEFAEEYGFSLTSRAAKLVNDFREAFENGIVMQATKTKGRKKAKDKPAPPAPTPDGIAPEFMDTED